MTLVLIGALVASVVGAALFGGMLGIRAAARLRDEEPEDSQAVEVLTDLLVHSGPWLLPISLVAVATGAVAFVTLSPVWVSVAVASITTHAAIHAAKLAFHKGASLVSPRKLEGEGAVPRGNVLRIQPKMTMSGARIVVSEIGPDGEVVSSETVRDFQVPAWGATQ